MWALILLALAADSKYVVSRNYEYLEKHLISLEIQDVGRAFDHMEYSLVLYTVPWSVWNDAYNFMKNKNQEFINNNFVPGTFTSSQINFFLFYDNNGKLFYGRQYDLLAHRFVPLSPALLTYLNSNIDFLKHPNIQSRKVGILNTRDGMILMSSLPILKSNAAGPVAGTMLMGYYLTAENFRDLSNTVGLELSFFPIADIHKDPELSLMFQNLISSKKPYVAWQNDAFAYGYLMLYDVNHKPVGMLRACISRAVYHQGLSTERHYLIIFSLLGIVVLAMIWYLMKLFILDRVISVSHQVQKISQTNAFDSSIVVSGSDEISGLVASINKMMRLINYSQMQLSYMAKHDALTHLPNRAYFYNLLENAIVEAHNTGTQIAVMFLDMDKFKEVNDQFGHNMGDKVLQHIATRIKEVVGKRGVAARQSGDEFIIYITNATTEIAEHIANELLKIPREKSTISSTEGRIAFSVGISMYPKDGETVEELVQHADQAMYAAKRKSSNTFHFYNKAPA
jgi:diguanylate cyclase (GGDEF)-like protein